MKEVKVLALVVCLALNACNSPRDHMISEEALENNKSLERRSDHKDEPTKTAAYSFDVFNINAEPQWLSGPFSEPVSSTLRVILRDAEGDLFSLDTKLYELGFNAFMPSMGHYLDDPGYFKEVTKGVYENPAVKFNMANDWRMDLMILNSNYEIVDLVQWLEII